jgi:two-component system phosphate regulon sensor histidine kinase PhoR
LSTRWRIAIPYVLLILVAMIGLSAYLSNFMRQVYVEQMEEQLTTNARILRDALGPLLSTERPDTLAPLAAHYADLLDARVTLIASDGRVLADSHYDRAEMDNHLYRPEVQEALQTDRGSAMRFSRTAQQEMMYVALTAGPPGEVVGFTRAALSLSDIEASLARVNTAVATGTLTAAILAVVLALFIADFTTHPARKLTQVVRQMAEGNLGVRLPPTTQDEIGELTIAFNYMAEQLQQQITALSTERSRLAGILEHMADGVVITDEVGQVQMINPAATRILGTTQERALEQPFALVARHHRLIEMWHAAQRAERERVETIETQRVQGRFLQVIISPLPHARPTNHLVVLQDLTRIRRLETVRRDFISNISHELRTPLATLKVLTETLQDGALEDPPAAHRFLDHMEQEVNLMAQLVEELMELSRIESGKVPFNIKPTEPRALLEPAVKRLTPQAQRSGLHMTFELPPDLPPVQADAERVERVVTNLVHNAIKFTPTGGSITVSACHETEEDRVVFSVQDTGIGIPNEDLPRIFERFYKTSRARSGGGTGLGLAIAKHIVQAHDGTIWVESMEGRGSTFSFSLPTHHHKPTFSNR